MTKPPSPAAMRRRIERLEKQNSALQDALNGAFKNYGQLLSESVEAKARIQQAIRILQGVEE